MCFAKMFRSLPVFKTGSGCLYKKSSGDQNVSKLSCCGGGSSTGGNVCGISKRGLINVVLGWSKDFC